MVEWGSYILYEIVPSAIASIIKMMVEASIFKQFSLITALNENRGCVNLAQTLKSINVHTTTNLILVDGVIIVSVNNPFFLCLK